MCKRICMVKTIEWKCMFPKELSFPQITKSYFYQQNKGMVLLMWNDFLTPLSFISFICYKIIFILIKNKIMLTFQYFYYS